MMNIVSWVVIVMIVAAFLVFVSLIFNNERYGLIARIIALLCIIVALFTISSRDLSEGLRQESATVPKLSQATNGLYEVLVTYQNVDGGTLVILHPAKIMHIDVTERRVASVRLGTSQLLAIDHPIAGPMHTNAGIFTGFVEIMGEGKNKVIQTFRPFPATQ